MKYAVQMGSVAMIYIYTKFHKDWFRHSKVVWWGGGGYADTDSMDFYPRKLFGVRKTEGEAEI
jgi:hypothetical protein